MPLRRSTLALIGLIYLTQAGYNSCPGEILYDDGFDLWCGEALCSGEVEQGSIRRTASWHAGDAAVELVGDGAAISQWSDISSWQVGCIRFDLVADVDEDAV